MVRVLAELLSSHGSGLRITRVRPLGSPSHKCTDMPHTRMARHLTRSVRGSHDNSVFPPLIPHLQQSQMQQYQSIITRQFQYVIRSSICINIQSFKQNLIILRMTILSELILNHNTQHHTTKGYLYTLTTTHDIRMYNPR